MQDAVGKEWFRSCPKGPANSATVLATALEIAAGMSYLHDRGIIHGDLSSGDPLAPVLGHHRHHHGSHSNDLCLVCAWKPNRSCNAFLLLSARWAGMLSMLLLACTWSVLPQRIGRWCHRQRRAGCHSGVSCAGNILLASTSTVPHGFTAKVSDFGLAREMDIQSKIATNTTGTVTYMPPETIADGMVSKVRFSPCVPVTDRMTNATLVACVTSAGMAALCWQTGQGT